MGWRRPRWLGAGLRCGNRRRLSGQTLTKIFTGDITRWDDTEIRAENPGLVLPSRNITPVVRGDGSGTTAQFTAGMASQHGALWGGYCSRAGRVRCSLQPV